MITKDFLTRYELFENEELKELTLLDNQGFSNTNYLLETSKRKYLIREFKSLHVNRKFEFQVAMKAYKKDIGAKPLFLDEFNAIMICEFLEGIHRYTLKRDDIKNIALLLKKLHQIKVGKKLFNLKKDYVLCHHDLNPKNFIFLNDIKLIDWEYAGINDLYFDLASVVVEFDLDKKEEKLFLNSYFQNFYRINRKKIYSFKIKYTTLCKDWFAKQNNQKEKIKYIKKLKNFHECNKR